MPSLRSDAAATRFVATADLTEYDLSGFKPMRIEIEPKSAVLSMRLPRSLLDAVKAEARAELDRAALKKGASDMEDLLGRADLTDSEL